MKQETQTLSTVCAIKNGFAFKSRDYLTKGIPLLRISNFNDGEVYINDNQIYVDDKYLKSKNNFIVEKGDVLIALSGATTGKYGIYNFDFPSLLNQRIGLIKSGESDTLNSRYFFYYLNILKSEILRNAGGAAQPNISTKKIGTFEIPLPPLDTQKRIAQILDDAAALRDTTAQLLKEYDLLAQSIFLEMFGDPVVNSKGWKLEKFKELCVNLDSQRVPIKQGDRDKIKGDFPYYGATGIVDFINDFKYDGEYLLIAEDGKNLVNRKKPLGWVVSGKFWVNNHAHVVAKKEISNLTYLAYHLNNMDISNFITGIDQYKLNRGNLDKIIFMNPPIKLQNQFADKIALIEQQKALAKQELQESEDLFNCLLQKAFKGELV